MASTLRVDNIQNASGTNLFVNGYPRQPGQIIEHLSSPCDGSIITGSSGSYTVQTVSTSQAITDSFADLTGSTISYVPPAGATKVIYKFDFSLTYSSSASPIMHVRFYMDSTEVTYARRDYAWQSTYPQTRLNFEWPIAIGGTSATGTTGRIDTWTAAKTLKLQIRRYSSTYTATVHSLVDWDGSNQTGMLLMPTITITAIA